MSEREIRNIIRSVCADLDERARRAANARVQKVVLPAALGVTLAVSGCSSERNSHFRDVDASSPDSEQVQPDAGVEGGPGTEAGNPDPGPAPEYDAPLVDAGSVLEYMAIMPDASADGATDKDAAQTVTDAAREDVGPVLEYAAPLPDAGAVPPYMAVIPDAGAVPPYMAVIPDAGVQALYMAVIVDSGDQNLDPTPVPLYDAPMPNK